MHWNSTFSNLWHFLFRNFFFNSQFDLSIIIIKQEYIVNYSCLDRSPFFIGCKGACTSLLSWNSWKIWLTELFPNLHFSYNCTIVLSPNGKFRKILQNAIKSSRSRKNGATQKTIFGWNFDVERFELQMEWITILIFEMYTPKNQRYNLKKKLFFIKFLRPLLISLQFYQKEPFHHHSECGCEVKNVAAALLNQIRDQHRSNYGK